MKRNRHIPRRMNLFGSSGGVSLLLLLLAGGMNCLAQQLTPVLLSSGGETFVLPDQSVEFAIGELATATFSGQTFALNQGFFQGTPQGTGISEEAPAKIAVRVFPNPADVSATVLCEQPPVKIELFDLWGRKLLSVQKPDENQMLEFQSLQKGIYLLRVFFKGKLPYSTRIVKK